MKYEEYRTIGNTTYSKEFEGSPEEILKLIKGLVVSEEENVDEQSANRT